MTKLKSLIKAQNAIINKLCQKADSLGELGKLTRSDQVKGGIVDINLIVDEVDENRKLLHPAFNEAYQLASKLANAPVPSTNVPDNTEVHNRLDKQEEKIDAIMASIIAIQEKKDAEQTTERQTEETPTVRNPESQSIDTGGKAVSNIKNKGKQPR